MKTRAIILSLAAVGLLLTPELTKAADKRASQRTPKIQIAILLDNSGSMSGLIEQAKGELWNVVNQLTHARRGGVQPTLEVALYTYGDPPAIKLSGLTENLDLISEALFSVGISGGSEYCGQAIQIATRELEWSDNPKDLKMIFIAGNEPFSQGPVDYRKSCKQAISSGIVVNTIHCGSGVPADWREGALLADGKSMSIDHNMRVAHIDAPQDKEIARLGAQLNKTYVAYGRKAEVAAARQKKQDSNAAGMSMGSSVQRAVSKANAFYKNSGWDLVDAVADGSVDLDEVAVEDLPTEMKTMSRAERAAYVKKQSAERTRIQKRINELNAERNKYVTKKRKEMATTAGPKSLDQALTEAIRAQGADKDFEFGDS